jgi:hypothetical protein
MLRIFQKWPLSWNMFHIGYRYNWKFNLETLLMLRIFGKWPPSWKMLSTIYQHSKRVNLTGNCHNLILKIIIIIVVNVMLLKTFSLKKGFFTIGFLFWSASSYVVLFFISWSLTSFAIYICEGWILLFIALGLKGHIHVALNPNFF